MSFELRLERLPEGIGVGEGPDLTPPPEPPRAEFAILHEGMPVGHLAVVDRAGVEYALAQFRIDGTPIERLETRELGGKLWLFAILRPDAVITGEPVCHVTFTTAPRIAE